MKTVSVTKREIDLHTLVTLAVFRRGNFSVRGYY